MTVKRKWIVENTWKCSSCQATNKGRDMKCTACGSVKEKDERDVVPDANTTPAVTDPKLLEQAKQGANWVCEYCSGQTRNAEGQCINCAAKKAQPPDEVEWLKKHVSDDEPGVTGRRHHTVPPYSAADVKATMRVHEAYRRHDEELRSRQKMRNAITVMVVIAIALVIGGLFYYMFASWEVNAKVSGIHWKYNTTIEQRVTKHDEGWGRPIFGDTFNVSCVNKYYGQENCQPYDCNPHDVSYSCRCTSYECRCHKSCRDLKNGYSECEEVCDTCQKCDTCTKTEYDTCYKKCDVYKDYCNWDYYEWPSVKQDQTVGSTHEVKWPDLAPDASGLQRMKRTEYYEVGFTSDKDQWRYLPKTLQEFQQFKDYDTWKISVNRVGTVHPIQKQ